ncbi:MAG: hypothetical protein B7X00_01800 [Legionella sp. 21-45-4]|nr:MAG: hypothetical protein B7X00_01800 [Legionella sp. 21-45-4]
MPIIPVVVAIITDKFQRVLITQRGGNSSFSGWWEFPGGKIEASEAPVTALTREVQEELGVAVQAYDYLGQLVHAYPDRVVSLNAYHVRQYNGEPHCCEQQQGLHWVYHDELKAFQLLEASQLLLIMLGGVIGTKCG